MITIIKPRVKKYKKLLSDSILVCQINILSLIRILQCSDKQIGHDRRIGGKKTKNATEEILRTDDTGERWWRRQRGSLGFHLITTGPRSSRQGAHGYAQLEPRRQQAWRIPHQSQGCHLKHKTRGVSHNKIQTNKK